MKQVSESDDSLGGVVLRIVDSVVTVGIVVVVVGVVLLTLFPPASFGGTSPLDLGTPASVATTSRQVYGPQSPAREASRKESSNLNLGKNGHPRMQSRPEGIAGTGGHHSENVIRTDETSVRLLAPWQ